MPEVARCVLQEPFAVDGVVFTLLLKFHEIAADEPVANSGE